MKELDEILSRVRRSKVTEFYSQSNFVQQYGSGTRTDTDSSSPYANDVPNVTTDEKPSDTQIFLPGKSGRDNSTPQTKKGDEGKEFPFINKLIKRDLSEAVKDENAPDPNEAETPEPPPEEPPGDVGGDPNLAMNDPAAAGGAPDPNVMDPNMDPNMMGGMGGNVDPMTGQPIEDPQHLGRIYEIKKIYTRLTSIESYLASESDEILVKIRGYVSQAIQLFEILASNLQTYKDKLDDIIIQYYKFLDTVFDLVKNRYKELKDKQK